MKQFFSFSDNCKRSTIEVSCNLSFDELEHFLTPCCPEKLPKDVIFNIIKGKKEHDIIFYHEAGSFKFYSEKIIKILSRYIDLTNKVYPIHIEKCKTTYYVVYNLQTYFFFNEEYSERSLGNEKDCFLLTSNLYPSIFNLRCNADESNRDDTNIIVISPQIKLTMQQEGITNIYFLECYGYDEDEYAEWKRRHGIIRDY